MDRPLDCPHCASSDVEVVAVEYEGRRALAVRCKECGASALAVRCKECGAFGPPSQDADPEHTIVAWHQRCRRLSLATTYGSAERQG